MGLDKPIAKCGIYERESFGSLILIGYMYSNNPSNKKISEGISVEAYNNLGNGLSSYSNSFHYSYLACLNPPSLLINLMVFL
jgi:hypothetical protein